MKIGSIEAGGTKFVCAVGNEKLEVLDQRVIATTSSNETLEQVIDYFQQFTLDALGISSFGPIEIRKSSSDYGKITNTPKISWKNVDLLGIIGENFPIPTFFTTDVNGSAYGEYILSQNAKEALTSLVYYTVGTGCGAGAIIDGEFVGSAGHLEAGHTFVKRHPDDLEFEGICPFHKDCLEGFVSGPTFEARLGIKGEHIPLEHPIMDIVAFYLAQAVVQSTLLLRPEKIIFGGSVVDHQLLAKIRNQATQLLNNYVILPDMQHYITHPKAANNGSATIGNFALGMKAYGQ